MAPGLAAAAAMTPLEWKMAASEEIEGVTPIEYVRKHGITQFISMYNQVKTIEGDELLWGEEVEYHIFALDGDAVKLSLRGSEVLGDLTQREASSHPEMKAADPGYERCEWVPEYGSWMVEGTPAGPYAGFAADLLRVEKNMRMRRARLLAALKPNEICPTVPMFPMMGVGDFTLPAAAPGGKASESLFVPDACINPHPRYGTLTANIRNRRGSKVDIRLPRFHDKCTPTRKPPGGPAPTNLKEALEMDEVYMDCMAFGMGCCCLQVTFQARDVHESRHLYDQLAVLTPVFLALTAAAPIARGVLVDTDVRWNVISASVDDRTPAERGAEGACAYSDKMAGGGKRLLPKSRYASISTYISENLVETEAACRSCLNDISCPIDEEAYKALQDSGVDAVLAKHISHLFVRDPLAIYKEKVIIDDDTHIDHFENLQSSNWQTVRWKPPPASSKWLGRGGSADIGWRVEFRSMEVNLTDFENAAFTVFVVLLSRIILYYDLNLYLPLSKVDENMKRASKRDAVKNEKFFFRQSIMPGDDVDPCGQQRGGYPTNGNNSPEMEPSPSPYSPTMGKTPSDRRVGRRFSRSTSEIRNEKTDKEVRELFGQHFTGELTVYEILTGRDEFSGLVPMIMAYLSQIGTDSQTIKTVSVYMDFICARASGELVTNAAWMRSFVMNHPDYKQDSEVSPSIAAELMAKCHRIGLGIESVPEMYGSFAEHIQRVSEKDAYAAALGSRPADKSNASQLQGLVQAHTKRIALTTRRRELLAELQKVDAELEELPL
eukprot:TRINITY_DN17986_c0_g1_i1.p1 TRINITY_DN17986_c0_g1~~TRINITY_DN17986_c0_g1_i1.p1  ORF type:complete len:777 (-),score=166.32 TRINITY_DN17986_c0_g1_i1:33-2363(-)